MNYPQQKEPLSELLKAWYAEPLYESAARAMATLIKKGCERHLIEGYLRRIVGYRRMKGGIQIYKGPKPAEAGRQLRACALRLRKVARRIGELRRVWGLWERLVDARCIHLPEELREIAERLICVRTKQYSYWNPHQEALLDLLEHVRSVTGRYHYGEVSDLINAAYSWRAIKNGRMPDGPLYEVDSLKMLVSRQKQLAARKSENTNA